MMRCESQTVCAIRSSSLDNTCYLRYDLYFKSEPLPYLLFWQNFRSSNIYTSLAIRRYHMNQSTGRAFHDPNTGNVTVLGGHAQNVVGTFTKPKTRRPSSFTYTRWFCRTDVISVTSSCGVRSLEQSTSAERTQSSSNLSNHCRILGA